MASDQTISPEPILAALDVRDASALTRATGGMTTSIWRVERPSGACALRVFRPGEQGVWRREIAAMAAARASGLPVPALDGATIGVDRPAMLLEWRAGAPLANALGRAPWLVGRLGRAFGRTQALIHQVPPPPDWQAEDWIAAAGQDEPELQRRLRAAPRPHTALLHLDYHTRNVLVDARGVTAVIDWANAQAGDPRADAARTYSILVVEPWQAAPESLWARAKRRVLAAAWRAGYESVAGPLGDMGLYYAWAGAMMARDLAWRVGDPASWWQPQHLAHIRRWTARWKRAIGGSG